MPIVLLIALQYAKSGPAVIQALLKAPTTPITSDSFRCVYFYNYTHIIPSSQASNPLPPLHGLFSLTHKSSNSCETLTFQPLFPLTSYTSARIKT